MALIKYIKIYGKCPKIKSPHKHGKVEDYIFQTGIKFKKIWKT